MKNKKLVIIFIVIVIIAGILAGTYKIMTSYMIKKDEEIKIIDGKNKLVNYLKNEKNNEKREEKVKLFLEAGEITNEEAKEVLNK